MKTAIIILNYNSENDTIRYVNEIKNYSCLDTIIIVDNNSTTENAFEKIEALKGDKIHVVKSDKNGGYSYGNNLGLKYLESLNEKYDYIVISNPDVSIKENAFEACFDELNQNEKIAVVAPKMVDKNGNHIRRSSWKVRTPGIDMVNSTRFNEILFYKIFKSGEYAEEDFKKPKLPVEAVSGALFVIRYDVFKQIGYFDENVFLFYEEDILASKLKNMGYGETSLNNVEFKHFESQTINKVFSYFNKIKRLQESKMYYQKKYNNINKFQICIFHILNIFRRIELLFEIPIRKFLTSKKDNME